MVKMWGRTVKNHKNIKQFVLILEEKNEWHKFWDYVSQICYNMDIATPIIMKSHLFNYAKYNYVRFDKSDFVENVDFDCLIIENINK